MKKHNIILSSFLLALPWIAMSQVNHGLSGFPELIYADIPGAPKLSNPVLIHGNLTPVISEGRGLAAPAFWDWDGDGIKDLLIGEFGSGTEHKRYVGNFIRIFKNSGTETIPEFTGSFEYARPPFEYLAMANGTPYSVDQFCCIGFTPQFIDLDQDGQMDMITGQYQGEVSWFRGTEKGFLPGEALLQEGDPRGSDWTKMKNQNYWLYSSASFGDFTGDGLVDLITGGGSMRISKNVGTKDHPQFSRRELLLDAEGNPLRVYNYTPEEFKKVKQPFDDYGVAIPEAGDSKLSPYVVDWDSDGILDLLVTNSYSHSNLGVVDFFKGVKVKHEHRFQKPKPLFTARNNAKAFPGVGPRVFVTDYNNDGINDLLIGTSIATMNSIFNDRLAWNWEEMQGIYGVDPGNLLLSGSNLQQYKDSYKDKIPDGISIDDFVTIRHIGYVYVMMGIRDESRVIKVQKSKK